MNVEIKLVGGEYEGQIRFVPRHVVENGVLLITRKDKPDQVYRNTPEEPTVFKCQQ